MHVAYLRSFEYHRLTNSSWDLKISDKASSPHPRHQHRVDWCHQRYPLAPCTPKPHTERSGGTTRWKSHAIIFVEKGIEFSLIRNAMQMLVKLPNFQKFPHPLERSGAPLAPCILLAMRGSPLSPSRLAIQLGNAVRLNGNMGTNRLYDAQDPGFAMLPAPSPVL